MFKNRSLSPLLISLAALALLPACDDDGNGDGTGGAGGTAEPADLVILFTSDEHSQVFGCCPELDDFPTPTAAGDGSIHGGVARRAALLKSERDAAAAADKAALTFSSGDTVMGTMAQITFETEALDWAIMRRLGYDAVSIGNHELDFGPGVLAHAIEAGNAAGTLPPLLASNIRFSSDDSGDDELAALYSDDVTDDSPIHPYHVITTDNGIRVGVIGFLGANAAYVAPNKTPVLFSGNAGNEDDTEAVLPLIYADLQAVVDTLVNEEAVDLVVGLGHSGLGNDPSALETAEDYQICENVDGLDLILSGHSHNVDAAPVVVSKADGGECVVLNAGAYGKLLGRIEYTITPGSGAAPTWDASTQALLPVDDSVIPDADFAGDLEGFLADIEAARGTPSYLEALLTRVEGTEVTDNASEPGDLYFRPLASTTFDVTDDKFRNFLSADAMLAATDALGIPTDAGLESAGVVRSSIVQGKTGVIAAADAYNVVPLGSSPVDPSSLGYPLIRANINLIELRAVFEFAFVLGPTDSDFRLNMAGLKVEYDATREPADPSDATSIFMKGWIMKIYLDTDHSDGFEQYDTLIFDRTGGVATTELISVVTSSYIAQFADGVGVTLKDDNGDPIAINDAILHYPDNSAEVKQIEAFLSWLYASPGGMLPDVYDVDSPNATARLTCLAGCN